VEQHVDDRGPRPAAEAWRAPLHVLHLEPSARPAAEDWAVVYRREAHLVFRYVLSRVGNRADSEDVCAQVFLRALPRLRPEAAPEEVHAYLLTTARCLVADHFNERSAHRAEELLEETRARPAGAPLPKGERRLHSILARLGDRDRRILELRFLRGYSVSETATALGVTPGTCKVIQLRALRRAAGLGDEREAEPG